MTKIKVGPQIYTSEYKRSEVGENLLWTSIIQLISKLQELGDLYVYMPLKKTRQILLKLPFLDGVMVRMFTLCNLQFCKHICVNHQLYVQPTDPRLKFSKYGVSENIEPPCLLGYLLNKIDPYYSNCVLNLNMG